jgi:hypothetical protein
MKDVAYFYNFKFYDKAVEKGSLENLGTATVIFLRQRKGLESRKMRGCGGEGG